MSTVLEIKNLKVNYKTFDSVKNVLDIDCIEVKKGRTFGIVGESGAGKTVLALTLLRLLQTPPGEIVSGEILFNGEDLLKKSEREMREIRGKKIAMVFQDPMSALNPVYTICQQMTNVILANKKISKKEAKREALEMIRKVKLPDPEKIMDKYPNELSGGQRQRIIIGMALLCGAEFIIADEPTRNLDVTIQAGVLKLIRELQREFNITVLFIANNLGLVSAVCDEIAILKEGVIVDRGNAAEIFQNSTSQYTRQLLNAITPAGRNEKKDAHVKETEKEILLDVCELKKYFPVKSNRFLQKPQYVKAVDDISFSLEKKKTLGIVGESGCGKSTLVNTILMLHRPTGGDVLFDKKAIYDLNKNELRTARKDVQIVFQDPFWSLNPRWLVKDIIGEPIKVHMHLSNDEYIEYVQEIATMVGLEKNDVFKYPHEFSGGQRQRIAIARALSVKPKLVVLDEPTSSIDVMSQAQILELLDDLKEKLNLTYIIISHDLFVVNYFSDNIIVMYLGKVVESGKATTIFDNPKHPYTQALFNAIPRIDTKSVDELMSIPGEVPSAINPPKGCRFHPRCEFCMQICREETPEMKTVEGREVACFLYNK